MVETAAPPGPGHMWGHSPDRRWWWNGATWVPACSPDGSLWWDGRQWTRVPRTSHSQGSGFILAAWALTLAVLVFAGIAALIGVHRSLGHDISGTALVLGLLLALIGPAVVILTWWADNRPMHPRLPRLKRLCVVGLTVGVPAAFVAFQLATFRY